MLEMTARGECVLIWGGFTLSENGDSQGVHEKGGFTGGSQKGGFTGGSQKGGVHKKGGSQEPVNPPGYGPAFP